MSGDNHNQGGARRRIVHRCERFAYPTADRIDALRAEGHPLRAMGRGLVALVAVAVIERLDPTGEVSS